MVVKRIRSWLTHLTSRTSPDFAEGYRPASIDDEAIVTAQQDVETITELSAYERKHTLRVGGWVETLDEPVVAYKACEQTILRLVIPEGATIVKPTSYVRHRVKYRTNVAYVDRVWNASLTETLSVSLGPPGIVGYSAVRDSDFHYPEFHFVQTDLDTDTSKSCTEGIHVFGTIEHAKQFWQNWGVNRGQS